MHEPLSDRVAGLRGRRPGVLAALLVVALAGAAVAGCGGTPADSPGSRGATGDPPTSRGATGDHGGGDDGHGGGDQDARAYAAPLAAAVGDLPVAPEDRTGYVRDLFRHWVDADGDGCDTRAEVLIAEADAEVTMADGCLVTAGRWFSYYDRVSWTDPGDVDIDHVVPLAEAWDSGAGDWTPLRREQYANDLGDPHSLVGVTDDVNQSKADQDPATWTPPFDRCRYLRDFVTVKVRWGLSVDPAEREAMTSIADGCADVMVVVNRHEAGTTS